MTGLGSLVRLILRRDRIRLPIWVLAIVGLVYASANAVAETYATPTEIQGYATAMGSSPAAIAFAGPPVALDTRGGIVVNETAMTALVAVALMAIFLVVRHTRAEEEQGRTEVLRSTVVGRHTPMAAALLVVSAASVLVGLGVALATLSVDLRTEGALLYGASVAVCGVVFACMAAVAAQLMTHARGAIGLSAAVLGVAFLLRAIGDVQENFASWLSPLGWSQQVHAFGEPRWWPLVVPLLFAALALAAAVELATRRDLGAGIVPPKPGPPEAAPSLSGPVGLALRLQRGSLIGWTIGMFIGGASLGSFSREVETLVESNPELAEFFGQSGSSLVDTYLTTMLFLMGLLATGFALSSALRLRSEETSGRLEPLLATGMSRSSWLLGSLVVTVAGSLVALAASGLGVGLAYGVVSDDLGQIPRMLGLQVVFLPAVLALAALAVLLFGWLPRLAAAAWAVFALVFLVGYLGSLLQFPDWVVDLSPFTHVPAVPAEELTIAPLVTLVLVVVLVAGVGLAGFRRRDIG